MADGLISILLEQLVSTTYEYIKGEVKLVLNAKKDVETFAGTLELIQAVLEDAEQRQETEASVRNWLDKLKDISYKMGDALDEWNTAILEQQVENQETESDQNAVLKVCFLCCSHCFCFGHLSRVIHHRKIAQKIQGLNDRLTEISEEKDRYRFQRKELGIIHQVPERKKTSSFVDISMMGATKNKINMGELSDEYCLSIFHQMAFFDREIDESKAFRDISKEIVRKCKGSPLAAKTLGSLMQNKRTMREWNDVLNSKIWDLEMVEQEVFQPLFLSYYDLAPKIKCCLLYCATFPKDFEFDRDNLINLWMAQGYVTSEGKENRITGHAVFDNLVARSFFQDLKNDSDSGTIISCKMHDIVHDFVQFLTKNECLIMGNVEGATIESKVLGDKVRHLSLIRFFPRGALPLSHPSYNLKNLRTLATFGSSITIDRNLILQLKCLRTLNLSRSFCKELPEEIGDLIHLRHIDLSNTDLMKLPDTICRLYNLSTLCLLWCNELKKLPENMGNLINLKHLYVKGSGVHMSKGIGRLTTLRTLDVCKCDGDNDEALKVGDLRNLNLEGSLTIQLSGQVTVNEVEEAQMWNKKLFHIRLEFSMDTSSTVEILNALRPHQDLEFLQIFWHTGSLPNWMQSLQNLRFLTICRGRQGELWPLGKLEFLERLTLREMYVVRKIGVEFLGLEDQTSFRSHRVLFPKLKQLKFEYLTGWNEWKDVEEWAKDSEITIMPWLSSLTIFHCDLLKALPDFLFKTPLQTLDISYCPILSKHYQEGNGEWAKISYIPNISISRNSTVEESSYGEEDITVEDSLSCIRLTD